MRDLLADALRGGYCVGYFEAWDQYSMEACLEAAEQTRSPAILGFGAAVTDQAWLDRWGVEELAGLARRLAEMSSVPTVALMNEARTLSQVQRGLEAGCNAVMLDSSHLPYAENLAVTRQVVALARPHEADVEAELGSLPDARHPDGASVPGAESGGDKSAGYGGDMTDPLEAKRFVEATGVDALAVSVGSVHSMAAGGAVLDLDRIAAIRAAAPVPLVLHGGSGIPASAVGPAAARGVAKINYGLRLKLAFLEGLREAVGAISPDTDIHAHVGAKTERDVMVRGQARVRSLAADLMRRYGTAGRA